MHAIAPATARSWLLERAIPLWLAHGIDRAQGGFHEELTPELTCSAQFRRLRVAARQTYVFARAAQLGVPDAAEGAMVGLRFLRNHARQDDGGYAMRFDLQGTPTDTTRDLYDHTFVLLALATTGERQAAGELLAYLDEHFHHPAGGWRESLPDALPRRQNPHMHLLEALLAAAESFEDTTYLDHADALIDLFLDRLVQPEGLPEYFDEGLIPLREQGNFIWEPGHHHEWVWLLAEHRRIARSLGRTPRDTAPVSDRLMNAAERHALLPDRVIAGEMWSTGQVRTRATRVWPHTERLKALRCAGGAEILPQALGELWQFLTPEGLWTEKWDEGLRTGQPAPASTLYHLTCAILDVSA